MFRSESWTDGSTIEPKKVEGKAKKTNKIDHTAIAARSQSTDGEIIVLRKWCHKKGRDGTRVPIS